VRWRSRMRPSSQLRRAALRGDVPNDLCRLEDGSPPMASIAASIAMSLGDPPGQETERSIGPYEILSKIGDGGIGVVFKARHRVSGQLVALKTVRQHRSAHLASIRRELYTVRHIDHPGVIKILDGGTDKGRPWYAMELLLGETLRQRFRQETSWASPKRRSEFWSYHEVPTIRPEQPSEEQAPPPREPASVQGPMLRLPEFLSTVHDISNTLAYVHGEGIVHRDLKPSNIFLRPGQGAVLMDFGLVYRYARGTRDALDLAGRHEGTIGYMAPEQIVGDRIDARADLFALGCILYEGVTGGLPFSATSADNLLREQSLSSPVPPRRWRPDIPVALEELIMGLLARRPEDRIGHATDVVRALEAMGLGKANTTSKSVPREYLYRAQFSGRQDAITELNDLIGRLNTGSGGLVLLSGESGIGKTSVLVELARSAPRRGCAVIVTECQPVGDSQSGDAQAAIPLQPFVPVLEHIADRCTAGGAAVSERILGKRRAILTPYCSALLEGDGPAPGTTIRMPDVLGRQQVFEALAATLAALARERPLVLIVDDLQWSDDLSLRFIQSLSKDYFQRTPILIVAGRRTDVGASRTSDLQDHDHAYDISLSRLEPSAIASMARDMLAVATPPADLVEYISALSGGNPFFVAEYLRTAVHERLLARNRFGQWRMAELADLGSLPLPISVEGLIRQRLKTATPHARRCLDAAAVVGRVSDVRLLADVLKWGDDDRLASAINELIERQLIEETEPGRLRFLHDKIREYTYEDIVLSERRDWHERVAESLETTCAPDDSSTIWQALGRHLSAAGLAARAVGFLVKAADHARARYANDDAIGLYEQAMKEIEMLPTVIASDVSWRREDARIGELLADLFVLSGRRKEAREIYERALAKAIDAHSRSRIQRKSGKSWETDREHERALSHYEAAETTLDQTADRDRSWWSEWLDIQLDRIWTNYWAARIPEMQAAISRAAMAPSEHASPAQRAHLHHAHALLGVRTERYRVSAVTVHHARLARDAGLESGDLVQAAVSRFGLGFAALCHGSLDEAEAELRLALDEARKVGDRPAQARALAYLMVVCRKRGDFDETVTLVRETREVAQLSGMKDYEGAAVANEGWSMLKRGDAEHAALCFEEALRTWRQPPAVYPFEWLALFPLLKMDLQRGDRGRCATDARALLHPNQERLPDELERLLQEIADESTPDDRWTTIVQRALKDAVSHGYI
jgi:serine/threonine protein kinase/tetratricopeptide (TPR) repeat protein